jgi:hypothetical protein
MRLFSYDVKDDERVHRAVVAIPAALMESSPSFDQAALLIATKGRSALEHRLARGRNPKRLTFSYTEHEFGDDVG